MTIQSPFVWFRGIGGASPPGIREAGLFLVGSWLLVMASTHARSQPPAIVPKPAEPSKKQEELPEVALVIPEETRPEVKAILKDKAFVLLNRRAPGDERARAAHVLGELGEKGKPVRGHLCWAMCPDQPPVLRRAAADALKLIDTRIQTLAVDLAHALLNNGSQLPNSVLNEVQGLDEEGEPLAPLVAYPLNYSLKRKQSPKGFQEITTLGRIARNDLSACQMVSWALGSPESHVRYSAMEALGRMKHGRLALGKLIVLLEREPSYGNQIMAIETLTALADAATEEIVADAIARQRFHKERSVREAVDIALNRLKNRANR